MKKFLLVVCVLPSLLFAQNQPFINSISPTNIEVGEKITISGSNLSNIDRVYFGGVSVTGASITILSDNVIEATVPAGATRSSVIVKSSNNLTAESSQQFFVNFSGEPNSSFKSEFLASIAPKTDVYDVCLCDLNTDGLNDVVLTHNLGSDGGTQLTVFQNNSTVGTESFTDINLSENGENPFGFISTTCGDIDGDGKPDAVFTSDGNSARQIFIYRNTSGANVSLAPILSFSLPTDSNGEIRITRRVKIADINGDGRVDLIVGNETDNTIHIFINTSSPGSFSFDDPVEIEVGEASSTGAFDVADLDNDGNKDLVIIPFNASNESIYILKNQSLLNQVSFELQDEINESDRRRNIILGDFNNDGLNDIATSTDLTTTGTGDESIEVYTNTTSGNAITFGSKLELSVPSNLPWGLDAADLNGDGRLDIATAAIGGAGTDGALYVFSNTSSTGSDISFGNASGLNVSVNSRNIAIGDLNGDAKPDLAYTHDILDGEQGDLGIQINETCIAPNIFPTNFSFCANENFTLSATNSVNGTYSWIIPAGTGTIVSQSGNEATFNLTSSSDVRIELQITGQQGCSSAPTAFNIVSLAAGSIPTAPTITVTGATAGNACGGDAITLSAPGFDNYRWTLPNGSISTESEISIDAASSTDAGTYRLSVQNDGGCSSVETTTTLSINEPPALGITNSNLDNFCAGTNVTLQIPDYSSDFNFQWYRDSNELTGETNTELSTNQSGSYRVDVIDPADGCITESATYTINAIDPPTSVANGPTEVCINSTASFTAGSTGSGSFTLEYNWSIEDNSNNEIGSSTAADFDFDFTATGTYEVTLTTNYATSEVYAGPNSTDRCESSNTITVTVSDPPSIAFDQTDLTAKCQAESINIGLSGPDASTISSYTWQVRNAATGDLISTIAEVNTLELNGTSAPVPVGVDTVWAVLSIGTTIGCEVRDSVRIRNFQSDLDISSDDFTTVLQFDSALLEDATAINLSATNAASDISWEPAENFSDPTSESTIFFPQNPTSTVTLTATDLNGCSVSTEIRVVLDNIRPKRTFSPNGDGMNDCWEILNIGDLGEANACEVFVFDARGRNIFTTTDFELGNCVWDGNFNGSPVPEGVYYYVLKCSSSEFTKSGSILLAR